MIPPIVGGIISYLQPKLAEATGKDNFNVWDGECPRYDLAGNAVGPPNTTGSWPAVDLQHQPGGMKRSHTVGTNAVSDAGMLDLKVWATTREECEQVMGYIEDALERQVVIYLDVNIGGPPGNPNYVFKCTLETYGCWVDPNYRTSNSQLLYRGELSFEIFVHTNAPTTS